MDKLKLVDRLRERVNISYEEAKSALEKNNWDILEAMLYLEQCGKVKKPTVSVFYTNSQEEQYTNSKAQIINVDSNESKYNYEKKSQGIFEVICKFIDSCNNIFFQIRRKEEVLLKLPFTVLIVLVFFAFWIIIPLVIGGLFFNIEYRVVTEKFNSNIIDKANKVFINMRNMARDIKVKFKKGF